MADKGKGLHFVLTAWGSICDNIPTRFFFQGPCHALFTPVPSRLSSNKNHECVHPVDTHIYSHNTSSHSPQIVSLSFLCSPFWILRRVTAVHSFPTLQFPVPGSPIPVLLFSFSVPLLCSPFSFLRSQFLVSEWWLLSDMSFPVPPLNTETRITISQENGSI